VGDSWLDEWNPPRRPPNRPEETGVYLSDSIKSSALCRTKLPAPRRALTAIIRSGTLSPSQWFAPFSLFAHSESPSVRLRTTALCLCVRVCVCVCVCVGDDVVLYANQKDNNSGAQCLWIFYWVKRVRCCITTPVIFHFVLIVEKS